MSWLDKKPIIALAPMADLTDGPFCRVCRFVNSDPAFAGEESLFNALNNANHKAIYKSTEKGSLTTRSARVRDYQPFVIFREMVSAEAVVRGNEKTLKMCEFEEIEKPIVLQMFGSKPEVMARAAEILVRKGLPRRPASGGAPRNDIAGIDINMGCPVPKIVGKADSGAALMKDHKRACEIVKALKKANLGLPISVKTRLGWSEPEEILEFAPMLEQAGADALTIHGRTKKQGYSGQANWEMIGQVKKLVKIPVIANGDIASADDIKRCLEITNADGVMIGRGALGNPWIFSSVIARSDNDEAIPRKLGIATLPAVARNDIKRVVLRHAELHLEHYGEGSMVTFRKHLLYYFKGERAKEIKEIKKLRNLLVKVTTIEELKEVLKSVTGNQ